MAARKKRGTKKGQPSNPSIPAGANRRAMATLTKKLALDLEKIDDQKRLLGKQESRLLDQYKKDTGRSKRATKRALAFYKMEDSVARNTEITDQIDVMKDLGLGRDMPLFQEAAAEAALASDLEREAATPGFIRSLGVQAHIDKVPFNECPYDEAANAGDAQAKAAKLKWEDGWLAEQGKKDEAEARKREAKAAKSGAAPGASA